MIRLGFKLLDVSVFIHNDDLFSLCTIVTTSVGSIVRKYIDTFEFSSLNFSRDGAGSYFISRLKYVISCVKDLINNINPLKIPMGTDPENIGGVSQADKGSHNTMMLEKRGLDEGQPSAGRPGGGQPGSNQGDPSGQTVQRPPGQAYYIRPEPSLTTDSYEERRHEVKKLTSNVNEQHPEPEQNNPLKDSESVQGFLGRNGRIDYPGGFSNNVNNQDHVQPWKGNELTPAEKAQNHLRKRPNASARSLERICGSRSVLNPEQLAEVQERGRRITEARKAARTPQEKAYIKGRDIAERAERLAAMTPQQKADLLNKTRISQRKYRG